MVLKIGTIVFFYGDTFYSKVINKANVKYYGVAGPTHTGIITSNDNDKLIIAEALDDGFIENSYSEKDLISLAIRKENTIEFGVPQVKVHSKLLRAVVGKYLGSGYGWFDILAIYLYFKFGFKFPNFMRTRAKKLICTEACARVLYDISKKKIDIAKEFNKNFDLLTPMDIYLSKYINIVSKKTLSKWWLKHGKK